MKKAILLVALFLLITPFTASSEKEVSVLPTRHFYQEYPIAVTDGDSVTYLFTIINIGNETIKGQKLWYDIRTPSGEKYDLERDLLSIDIPELEPGNKTSADAPKVLLEDVGTYTLHFGINSHGSELSDNEVIVNGGDYTHNIAQDKFRVYDSGHIFGIIIAGVIAIICAVLGGRKR